MIEEAIVAFPFHSCFRGDLLPLLETLFNKLTEYEHTGIDFHTDSDAKKRIIAHPNHEYEQMLDGLTFKLANPYSKIIAWIKKEIYDL